MSIANPLVAVCGAAYSEIIGDSSASVMPKNLRLGPLSEAAAHSAFFAASGFENPMVIEPEAELRISRLSIISCVKRRSTVDDLPASANSFESL